MTKNLNRFEVRKEWLGMGYTCAFYEDGQLKVYNHDKNWRYWNENIRSREYGEHYSCSGKSPKWVKYLSKK